MDFLPVPPRDAPPVTLNCLAVITIGANAANGRRSSSSSNEDTGGTGLARILSGGRRRSSAGLPATDTTSSDKAAPHPEGTWFWRAKVGITDDTLFILPADTPANPILRQRPHDASDHQNGAKTGGGLIGALRRASVGLIHKPENPSAPTDGATPENRPEASPPSPTKATDDEAHHETGWPAVVEGQQLQAIVVPVSSISKDSVHHDSKKNFHVSLSIGSAIAGKAGHLRFEFHKDWIGAKGETELLYNKLQTAVQSAEPVSTTVRLSGKPVGDAEYNPNWQDQVRGKW